jgi:ABC-type phosphate transport system substrate-binding protein
MKKTLFTLAALAASSSLYVPAAAAADGFVAVVAKNSTETKISHAQLRRIMTGEASAWPDGAKASVLIGPAGDAARTAALKSVCSMSEADYGRFLLHQNFNGDGKTPAKTMPSAIAVRQFVTVTPGAIGILKAEDVNDSVKTLTVE